jgi:hypothetical protein
MFTPRGIQGGYRGYTRSPQGYAQLKKPHPIEAFLGTIFIWRYAKKTQFWFGGTQRGTILIWGYASTKRLRTPDIEYTRWVVLSKFRIGHCNYDKFGIISDEVILILANFGLG